MQLKVSGQVEAVGHQLGFEIFGWSLTRTYNKKELHKVSDYWFRHMPNFDFVVKSLWLVSPPPIVYAFFKIFLMLCALNWPNLIVWLHLLLGLLGNMWIVSTRFHDVKNFEINLCIFIKQFSCMTEKSQNKNLNNLRTKRAFKAKYLKRWAHLSEIGSGPGVGY